MSWGRNAWGSVAWGGRGGAGVAVQAGVAFLTGSAIEFSGGILVASGTASTAIMTGNLIHFSQGTLTQSGEFQWTLGTIDLTQNSPIVVGLGTGWLAQISARDLLLAHTDEPTANLLYEIASVQTDEQLTVSAPWQGPSMSAMPYLIHRRHGSLPRLSSTDQGLAQIITFTMIKIDAALQGFSDVAPPTVVWILDTGAWNDSGQWLDSDTWQDS